ncbi:MAG: nuclear transport factor 2 family protein [Rhodospirillales bacterium]|nr:nuclear transport factor 2 family protein [Rhodospirillales bacterium]
MSITTTDEIETTRTAIRETIYRACLLLDDGRFADWLDLCAPDFRYQIKAFSPEIRKEMTWYEQDVSGLRTMIEMLPKHNTDHGRLMRHATVYTIDIDRDGGNAVATTAFSCYRTAFDGINSHLDAGESQLFVIGRYHDRLRLGADGPRFVERTVVLDTRRLDKGSHYPV